MFHNQFPCGLLTGVERVHRYRPPCQVHGAEEFARHGNLVGLGVDPCTAHEELAWHGDRTQDGLAGSVAGLLAIHHDQLVDRDGAAHLGLDLQQSILEGLGIDLVQKAGEGRLAGGREGSVRTGADSHRTTLSLGEATRQLGQILLSAWGITEHGQQHEGRQCFWRIRLRPCPIVGQVLEVLGQ